MQTLTVRQFATIKRVAQNVNPLVVKKNKLTAKVRELMCEIDSINRQIEGHEMGIKELIGKYTSEDLVEKVVEMTDKFDKEGNPIKVTKYIPRKDLLVFDEKLKVFEIIEQGSEDSDSNLEDLGTPGEGSQVSEEC